MRSFKGNASPLCARTQFNEMREPFNHTVSEFSMRSASSRLPGRSNDWSSAHGTARPDRAAAGSRHGVLSSSERLMRILRWIVDPTAGFVQLSSAMHNQFNLECHVGHAAVPRAKIALLPGRVAQYHGIDRRSRDGKEPCMSTSLRCFDAAAPTSDETLRPPYALRAAQRDRRCLRGRAVRTCSPATSSVCITDIHKLRIDTCGTPDIPRQLADRSARRCRRTRRSPATTRSSFRNVFSNPEG